MGNVATPCRGLKILSNIHVISLRLKCWSICPHVGLQGYYQFHLLLGFFADGGLGDFVVGVDGRMGYWAKIALRGAFAVDFFFPCCFLSFCFAAADPGRSKS